MKLFGWKAAGREESRPALAYRRSRFIEGWAAGPAAPTYPQQVQALYLRNAIAQRAVRMVAEGVGDAPLSAMHELLALVKARSGGQALTTTLAAHLLLQRHSVLSLDLPVATIGTEVRLMAAGPGDPDDPVLLTTTVRGTSIVPPSPVHLRWRETGDGDAAVQWMRRGRSGWRWIDSVDVPLGEEQERYRITLSRGDGTVRTLETDAPALSVAAADRAGGVVLAVRQVGAHGESPTAEIAIPAWAV